MARLLTRAGAARPALTTRAHTLLLAALIAWPMVLAVQPAAAQPAPPRLTQPVNDFAGVIDAASAQALDQLIRALQQASGDVVVVATIDTFQPYADLREYAVKMFENGGAGIGQKGKDNGLLVVLAVKDRRVWVEVGYDLEGFVTDGLAGQISREEMAPLFGQGRYGAGLAAGVQRIVERVAQGRNVTLQNVPQRARRERRENYGGGVFVTLFVVFIVVNAIVGAIRRKSGRRPPSHWGGGPWSGWSSGVGPFIGGRGGGGGFGGGGFGGGFGGFGGGRSGGGGGGAGW
jgi:uncharacterized protein